MLWSQKRKEKKKVLKGGGKVLVHAPFHRMPCGKEKEGGKVRKRGGKSKKKRGEKY